MVPVNQISSKVYNFFTFYVYISYLITFESKQYPLLSSLGLFDMFFFFILLLCLAIQFVLSDKHSSLNLNARQKLLHVSFKCTHPLTLISCIYIVSIISYL